MVQPQHPTVELSMHVSQNMTFVLTISLLSLSSAVKSDAGRMTVTVLM